MEIYKSTLLIALATGINERERMEKNQNYFTDSAALATWKELENHLKSANGEKVKISVI